jgi:hypothetical protein
MVGFFVELTSSVVNFKCKQMRFQVLGRELLQGLQELDGLLEPILQKSVSDAYNRSDQIWRIFAYWEIVYFGHFFLNQ